MYPRINSGIRPLSSRLVGLFPVSLEVYQALVPGAKELPSGTFEYRIGTHRKVDILGVRIVALVDDRCDNGNQISFVIENRTSTVARTGRSCHLDHAIVGARNHSRAKAEAQAFRMADHKDVFSLHNISGTGHGLGELSVPRLSWEPQQKKIEILTLPYHFGARPCPGSSGH